MAIKIFNKRKGFTLIETLVVISIFSVLAVITAQLLLRVIRSTTVSNSSSKIRENMEYALAVTERTIRNSRDLSCVTAPNHVITLTTPENTTDTISCSTSGGITSLFHNTDRLLSRDVNLTTCSLVCSPSADPTSVQITLEGVDSTGSYSSTPLKLQTQVSLRTY